VTVAHDARDRFEYALMQRLVEVIGLKEARDAFERVVVDENSAKQRLFRLNVEGRLTEGILRLGLWRDGEVHGP
jgi:hypothetical protein